MKIKRDFITNSSSTSFLLAFKGEFSEKKLLVAFGIEEESPLCSVFKDLFASMGRFLEEDFNLKKYDNEVLGEKLKELKKEGKKVYLGSFSSESDLLESFLCVDSYVIDTEEVYFDGRINTW